MEVVERRRESRQLESEESRQQDILSLQMSTRLVEVGERISDCDLS